MRNNIQAQSSRNVFQHQSHPSALQRPHGGVRQDKYASERVRAASRQPVPVAKSISTHQLRTKNIRSKNRNVPKRQTVLVGAWVKPRVKEELQRIADTEGLTISSVSATLLERSLQQNIDMQYGELLEPIIRQEIRRQMRTYSSRIALLLVRVAFASEQTRNIVTNILARQPGVKPDILDHILDSSSDAAKSKITAKTPQLESIIAEVEQWFTEKGGGRTQE
jgi:hypothetical protein